MAVQPFRAAAATSLARVASLPKFAAVTIRPCATGDAAQVAMFVVVEIPVVAAAPLEQVPIMDVPVA